MKNAHTFGIIGFGVVGQATASMLKDYIFMDPQKLQSSDNGEILHCEAIFICVNTNYNEETNHHEHKNLIDILNFLTNSNYKGYVIIRTTCDPILINKYFKRLNIVAMPEFLNQNTAFADEMKLPVTLGGDYNLTSKVEQLLHENSDYRLPPIRCTFEEAMYLKLTRNLYGAYKVLFWNFIQDFTGNARKMHELFRQLPEQGDMEVVGMDGERGFGGKCFPKDLKIASDMTPKDKRMLLDFMLNYNTYLKE